MPKHPCKTWWRDYEEDTEENDKHRGRLGL